MLPASILTVLVFVGIVVGVVVDISTPPPPPPATPPGPDDPGAVVADDVAAVRDELDTWWVGQLRDRGLGFLPVRDRLTDGDDGLTCDDEPVVIDDELYDNAWAAMCIEGATVAFDPRLFPGPITMQVVLAHEWGHIVQFVHAELDITLADPDAVPAEGELQADCFAGAWAAEHMTPDELEQSAAIAAWLGDAEFVADDDPDGHGTEDEREAAFLTGIEGGIDACLPGTFDPR